MEWNNLGIHYVTLSDRQEDGDEEVPLTSSAESVAAGTPLQEDGQHQGGTCKVQLNDGLSCFRKAFQFAKDYCLIKKTQMLLFDSLFLNPNGSINKSSNYKGTIAELRIGLADESILGIVDDDRRRSRRPSSSTSSSYFHEDFTEFLFTRPFTISTTSLNFHEETTAYDSPCSVLPCAVTVFNMALMYHLLATTATTAATEASTKSGATTRFQPSRANHVLRQSVCLYQTCWELVSTLLKKDEGGDFATAPSKRRRIAGVSTVADDELLEVLGMAALNNMIIASYELADYYMSYDLSYRLRALMSTSVYFQHQCVMESSITYPMIRAATRGIIPRTSNTTTSTTNTEQESLYHQSNNGTNYDQSYGHQEVHVTIPLPAPAASNLNLERWNFMLNTVVFTMPTLLAPSA